MCGLYHSFMGMGLINPHSVLIVYYSLVYKYPRMFHSARVL